MQAAQVITLGLVILVCAVLNCHSAPAVYSSEEDVSGISSQESNGGAKPGNSQSRDGRFLKELLYSRPLIGSSSAYNNSPYHYG